MRKLVLLAVFVLAITVESALFAQSTGTIQGSVTDPTGAGVPNAAVSVKNQSTGEERSTTTEASGLYSVPSLAVGLYRVEVRAPGLQTTAATNLEVSVGTIVKADILMRVASSSEIVEVSGGASLIETANTSVGAIVNQRTVQEIPLNGRHFVDLALLIPGSVTPRPTDS